MNPENKSLKRPVTMLILDGWGYAPRTERNAIAAAHTPYYDEVCRTFGTSVLTAAADVVPQPNAGSAEAGHLSLGTGRKARTAAARIKDAVESGGFLSNEVLNRAFSKAKDSGAAVHLIGLLSDGGVHSSTDALFALLRLAKQHGLSKVFLHCILDGLDVPQRTADVYVEALEIKLADIGVGQIATLCGRFFAMDSSGNWERTARAYTMLVHGEGERAREAVSAIRNSFLRGISDEFISPIVLEKDTDTPVTHIKTGDLVLYFNHRPYAMRQLVRSVSVPDQTTNTKPMVDTVCMTEYDGAFNLPVAFPQEPAANTLIEVLSGLEIPNIKISESARFRHVTYFFDGGSEAQHPLEEQILVPSTRDGLRYGYPESESFKVTNKLLRRLESSPNGFFVANLPAAGLMAETGDFTKTVAAIQYVDTCLGGVCEKMKQLGGVLMITSSHAGCEEMRVAEDGERVIEPSSNPVPFHYIDYANGNVRLRETGSLEDAAPTVLGTLDVEKPLEMTGTDLRRQ